MSWRRPDDDGGGIPWWVWLIIIYIFLAAFFGCLPPFCVNR